MELINQHTKQIMEGCKERAREAGLEFQDESLEYLVTNRDLLELTPKIMIPTLYDYWVQDVEVLKEKGKYELYPSNPYETVINTRPAISFYNDNNPDWLNVMIFYHVLGHIDFFQNNLFYRHTWDYDFTGEALSDKRVIAKLRAEKGRWVDYVIEFSRGIDNLVGYYDELSLLDSPPSITHSRKMNFYFDYFLQNIKKINISNYIKEVEKYNQSLKNNKKRGENNFFSRVERKHPEFEELFKKSLQKKTTSKLDLLQFIIENSIILKKEENQWMKSVIQVIRKTALFFQPQIRTKIMNEGWASYWHETLFMQDDRISGHEVDFARVNAGVTAMPRVGLNPYALGMRLFYYIEEAADKGRLSYDFQRLNNSEKRKKFDNKTNEGKNAIFQIRKNLNDFLFINTFVDQDFINQNNLFVSGRRLNKSKMVWEYYVKSRKAKQYRQMLFDSLYHPPHIEVDQKKSLENSLYLTHKFEEKPLVKEYLLNTLIGLEYLWGGPVNLETSEYLPQSESKEYAMYTSFMGSQREEPEKPEMKWQRVLYTIKDRKLTRKPL